MTIKELIISESSLTFLVRLMIVFESSCKPHGHLGASCWNIGRIHTKENIAVVTHLIGILPSSLGSFSWSYLNHSLTPFGSDFDHIRIRVIKNSQGHLGASYSNIGHIRTKENIAVGTLLIDVMPKLIRSFGGFLFKLRSYSNQREHSCRYPFDWQSVELIREFSLIIFES